MPDYMDMNWNSAVSFVTPIVIAGATSFISFVFLLPTKVGERLVSQHFEEKLAALKHAQGIELGRLQAELDHFKDRGIRSNEREFQAITAEWEAFVDAYDGVRRCIVQYLSIPDLDELPESDLAAFLDEEGVRGRSADFITKSTDKKSAYSRYNRSKEINAAGAAVWKAKEILGKQSVFIPDQLAQEFERAINQLNMARTEQFVGNRRDHGAHKQDASLDLLGDAGEKMFETLREKVRKRLLMTISRDDAEVAER